MRKLAKRSIEPLGLGCMGMSEFYGERDDEQSLETLRQAWRLGIRHFDTADMYGIGHNEKLLSVFIKELGSARDELFLGTKCGIERNIEQPTERKINGHPKYIKRACDASLQRLGVDSVDLYYLHRVDPEIPIEESVGTLGELATAGKIQAIGLSETNVETIQRAKKEHPISAIQSEYSLWTRDAEEEVLPFCQKNGIAFVAYSPLGRGFLTGTIRSTESLTSDDYRRKTPRFEERNLELNLKIADRITAYAKKLECTAAQLSIAWVLAKGDFVHAIPGTKKKKYLEENFKSLQLSLSQTDLDELNELVPRESARGARYPAEKINQVNR